MYLSSSNVPHAKSDTVGRLHGKELGPLGLRAIGDFDNTGARALFTIDPRNLILSQIDVGSGTIRGQMSVVDGRDCGVLAKIF